MTTLAVVEEILRETAVPMSVREIVERAGVRLPSKSKTPDTVVARDLSMDLKRKGDGSLFARTSPGRYTLRVLATAASTGAGAVTAVTPATTTDMTSSLRGDRAAPMAALPARKPASTNVSAQRSTGARGDREADGGGIAG
jgi:hypothetical protein